MARSRARWLGAAGLACAGLSGCATFWDDVTSRDFNVKTWVNPPDPMTVLRTSTDGDARAKALRRLDEPAAKGDSAGQEEALVLLTRAAASDPQPICRMAAIHTLGRFRDPRAAQSLVNAYEAADQLTPDVAYMARAQALTALGETGQPEAAKYLAQVARQPVKADLPEVERGQVRDVRLAAVRALSNFKGSEMAAATAGQLARAEKDVAVRDRAREAYAAITGQEAPGETLLPAAGSPVQQVGYTERKTMSPGETARTQE